MHIKKGKIIYLVITSIIILLLFLPNSLNVFRLPLNELFSESYNLTSIIPDILSILALVLGYIALRLFYTRRSMYIKMYPIFVLGVFILWTVVIQFK